MFSGFMIIIQLLIPGIWTISLIILECFLLFGDELIAT